MKLRSFLLIASFLLFVPLAQADQAPVAAPAVTADLEAAIFSAPTSPDCANAELPVFEPTPTEKQSLACGSCSDSLCAGKSTGQFCKYQNGRSYYCQHAYVVCVPRDCQCWTGPLP